ncbi:hypothetical protein M513_14099, partial [Trichuris suis]
MSYNYVVTAHPSTAVTLALSGNFTSSDSVDLLMFKTNRFEVFTVCGDKLNLRQTVKLHARIAAATLFVAEGMANLSTASVVKEVAEGFFSGKWYDVSRKAGTTELLSFLNSSFVTFGLFLYLPANIT